jgi:hypothetical protein
MFSPAFWEHTDKERRKLQEEFLACQTKKACESFISDHSTCYTELQRLPYFDVCWMIVIDPMHNLFLGLAVYVISSVCIADPFISRAGEDSFLPHMSPASCPLEDQGTTQASCNLS